jgi:hypothetical protein
MTAFFSATGMRECSRPTMTPGRAIAQVLVGFGGIGQVQRLAFLDQRAHPVDLPPCGKLGPDAFNHLVAPRSR